MAGLSRYGRVGGGRKYQKRGVSGNEKKPGALSPSHRTFSIWPPISLANDHTCKNFFFGLAARIAGLKANQGQAPSPTLNPAISNDIHFPLEQ